MKSFLSGSVLSGLQDEPSKFTWLFFMKRSKEKHKICRLILSRLKLEVEKIISFLLNEKL